MITNTLNGTFYYDASQSITSIALAQGFIAKNAPTGVFTATQSLLDNPGYNGNDNSTVKGFLGTDGNSYVGNNTNLQDGIFDLKAFVNVPAANSYTFRLGSDDGSALFVDGKEVINNDGVHAYANLFGSDALTAGQHSVEVLYFNHSYQGGQGASYFQAAFGGLNTTTVPASAAPEPSAIAIWAFVGLGAAGLVLKARKRKAAAA